MWSRFSNPAKFEALARAVGPFAFGIFATGALFGLYTGLFASPADYQQGDAVRIMYVHVPAAWMALASYSFIALMSLVAFVWRHSLADVAARAVVSLRVATKRSCSASCWLASASVSATTVPLRRRPALV